MRNIGFITSILILVIAGCKSTNPTLRTYKKTDWWDTRQEISAEVVELLFQPEQVFFYEFLVGAKVYRGGYGEPDDLELIVKEGSLQRVAYNPLNPEENVIIPYKPVFLEENIDSTLGIVTHCYNRFVFMGDTIKKLVYEYRVGRKIRTNWCFLGPDDNRRELNVGDVVSINYSLDHFRINQVSRSMNKDTATIVYFNTGKRTKKQFTKAAEGINFKGTIYWLKHPDLESPYSRELFLESMGEDEQFNSIMKNVEIKIY